MVKIFMLILNYLSSAVHSYLSDNIDTEIQSFEVSHSQESSWHNLTNQVTTQIQIFQRFQLLKVSLAYSLKLNLEKNNITYQCHAQFKRWHYLTLTKFFKTFSYVSGRKGTFINDVTQLGGRVVFGWHKYRSVVNIST